jgi:CheY-like chemotaxis protein
MCHVLIIEDEVLFALELSWVFSCAGATSYDVAETADEAVYAASVKRPDIIASDVKLRSGSGVDAVAAIQAALGPIPVVFITALPDECRQFSWPARVLAKPLDDSAIARAFRELTAEASVGIVRSPGARTPADLAAHVSA